MLDFSLLLCKYSRNSYFRVKKTLLIDTNVDFLANEIDKYMFSYRTNIYEIFVYHIFIMWSPELTFITHFTMESLSTYTRTVLRVADALIFTVRTCLVTPHTISTGRAGYKIKTELKRSVTCKDEYLHNSNIECV